MAFNTNMHKRARSRIPARLHQPRLLIPSHEPQQTPTNTFEKGQKGPVMLEEIRLISEWRADFRTWPLRCHKARPFGLTAWSHDIVQARANTRSGSVPEPWRHRESLQVCLAEHVLRRRRCCNWMDRRLSHGSYPGIVRTANRTTGLVPHRRSLAEIAPGENQTVLARVHQQANQFAS